MNTILHLCKSQITQLAYCWLAGNKNPNIWQFKHRIPPLYPVFASGAARPRTHVPSLKQAPSLCRIFGGQISTGTCLFWVLPLRHLSIILPLHHIRSSLCS